MAKKHKILIFWNWNKSVKTEDVRTSRPEINGITVAWTYEQSMHTESREPSWLWRRRQSNIGTMNDEMVWEKLKSVDNSE